MTARRRRTHKKTTHRVGGLTPYRKRSTSKLAGIDVTSILAVAGGGAAAGFINKVLPSTLDPKIVAVGKVALGAVMPMLAKEGKTKMMLSHFGEGFIAVGTYELLKGMGVISGIGAADIADDDLLAISLEGIDDVEYEEISENVLNGDDLNVINDDVLAGDLNVINGDLDQTY